MGPAASIDAGAWRPESAFRSVGLARHVMAVRDTDDLAPAFEAARREGVGAVMLGPSTGVLRTQVARVAELAVQQRWPSIADLPTYAEGGLLLAYGADMHDLFRRAATHAVKILRGASPAELPFEQPTKFTIVANVQTAKAMDLTLPQSLLLRADRVIS
jgi:putative ABC transport system substrate-binding protein